MNEEMVIVPKQFILSLCDAIYVRYEILTDLAHKRKPMNKTEQTTKEIDMSKRIIHVAGPSYSIHTERKQKAIRIIQRCMICGELLIQKKVSSGKRRASFWEPGDLVEIRDNEQVHVMEPDDGLLPPDTCAVLVEDNVPDPPTEPLDDEDDDEDDEEGE